jgi:uncharacterized protein YbjT (DUF2867 family)
MHVLVLGAAGFVGRHLVTELLNVGHKVTVAGRTPTALALAFPDLPRLRIDLVEPPDKQLSVTLAQVDVLINAAGLLDGPALDLVHVAGPRALYAAAAKAGVKRVVLISAISARSDVPTGYSLTKLQGEAVLRSSGIPWTILRPSLIVAKGSFGGTSVLRGLAGFPLFLPTIAGSEATFSPLHARDLGRAVVRVIEEERFAGETLEPAGSEALSLADLTRTYRRWLGFPPSPEIAIPGTLVRLAGRLGDILGGGPISSMGLDQLAAGNAGDGTAFATSVGFQPLSFADILQLEPADVQDRWHARLFFLRLGLRALLILIWIVSGLAGLVSGLPMATAFVAALNLPVQAAQPLVILTSVIDLTVAVMLLLPHTRRLAVPVQVVVVLAYTLGLTLVMPWLWVDPFGALLKNLAVLGVIAIDAALLEPR